MDVADEAKRFERRVPRFPFLFDGRVFGGVLFSQGRFGERGLGREAGEQQNQHSFQIHDCFILNVLFTQHAGLFVSEFHSEGVQPETAHACKALHKSLLKSNAH